MTRMHGATIELDVKGVDEDGTFAGYAATFGNEDLGRDIIVTGAFAKSLEARPAAKIKMLRGHDTTEPVGVWIEAKEDARGLFVKGRLIQETRKGSETLALLRAGALDALSIGYRTLKDRFDRVKGVRFLEELDLFEVSIVTFAMNPKARISSVKQYDPDQARAFVSAIERARAALRAS